MKLKIDSEKQCLIRRLRKIEGQIKGIQKMINEDKCCNDVLIQVAAARSALNKVGGLILQEHMKCCLKDDLKCNTDDEKINELIDIILKYTK